ncbi:hypothetical protein TNIN_372711 [Trichonephila inaurata madagascariensis]|uniref:Uncharacterized protein n=1 Tax=Trichonephila inaurata madagascariensis TaxID=2747483 RepID=A0A8X6WW49_9ARAC|nr:hypothetical protein TNIN_372711 [Trichonephila inaurata madagascariensis]
MIRVQFCASLLLPKIMPNLTTDIRNVDGLPRNSSVLQTHWTPNSRRGTTQAEKYRFSPPSARRQMFAFQHLSSHFGALTCTIALRTGRGCAWDIQTHTQSLYGTKKESKTQVRERPLKLIAEVAYIKVAPVSGL